MRRRDKQGDGFPLELIDPDETLGLVIDAVLIGSGSLRKLTKKVLKAQRRLRRAVDNDAWKAYLRLEEVVNERDSIHMDVLLRWALGHGSRSRR